MGPYEQTAPAWATFGVPEGFRADLLPLDLDRIEAEYASMLHRIPSSETCGLKDDYNGPICYTPDGNPLLGPAPGVENFWFAEGFSFGITAAGGAGCYLAQKMVEGEAEIDMRPLDPRRFGRGLNRAYAAKKNEEAYAHVYVLHHPDEERPATRPLRTAPCYERMAALGARFGQVNGWERPNYFADSPAFSDHDARSFRRGGWWKFAEAEARAIRQGVGLIDATAFAKHRVGGPGAAAFLDWFTCNRLPGERRVSLTYALTESGTVRSEYTILRLADDDFYLIHAGAAQAHDGDILRKEARRKRDSFGWIEVQDVTSQWGVFALAGPRSRDVLKKLVFAADSAAVLSNRAFPWLSAREIDLGMVPTLALRVAYAGELGWDLHHPIEMQNRLFDSLMEAGAEFGLKPVGARAQNWLRQDKSYRAFGADIGRDATPFESGLERFVDMSKTFNGKAALETRPIRARCVTLMVDGPEDADPWGREAIWHDGEVVGRLTSGGWSVALGRSIALGYAPEALSAPGTKLKIRMFRELWEAEVLEESPHDPTNARIRADG